MTVRASHLKKRKFKQMKEGVPAVCKVSRVFIFLERCKFALLSLSWSEQQAETQAIENMEGVPASAICMYECVF